MRVTRSLRVTRLPSHDRYFTIFFGLLFGREEKKKRKFNPPRFTVCSPPPPRNIFSFRFCAPRFPCQKNSEKIPTHRRGEKPNHHKTQKYNPYPKTKTLMIKLHSTKNTEKLFESYATRGKHQSPSVPDTPVRTVT